MYDSLGNVQNVDKMGQYILKESMKNMEVLLGGTGWGGNSWVPCERTSQLVGGGREGALLHASHTDYFTCTTDLCLLHCLSTLTPILQDRSRLHQYAQ